MNILPILLLLTTTHAVALSVEAIQFETADGQRVEAEQGRFEVPLHHDRPGGPKTTLAFVRFPATGENPGPPIVYLAGGPGGSGIATARGRRFPLFMALREFGDVIAFDQRGTGDSEPPPPCVASKTRYTADQPLTRERFIPYAIGVAQRCVEDWADRGVDLSAYNTWESAGDLEVLRDALGADKLTLWGISYGTHLALAAVKRLGDEKINRAILASAEGLDQTVKLPRHWDGYLGRLAGEVAADPKASQVFPDIVGTLRGVLADLEREPVKVKVMPPTPDSAPVELALGPAGIRFLLAGMGKNPDSAARIPAFVYGMAAGNFSIAAQQLYGFIYARPMRLHAMPLAMDYASGISSERLATVREQARTALMGDVLNYPMPHFAGALAIPVLADEFRAPFSSEVPALVLTGTLDGRTFPEAHAEVLAQFTNGRQLIIENAGHDLFMVSLAVTEAIVAFMRGETPPGRLTVEPPEFVVP